LAAQELLPVLVVLMLLSGARKRLETCAALRVWTCSVLKFEEQTKEALPYLKPSRTNKYSEKEIPGMDR